MEGRPDPPLGLVAARHGAVGEGEGHERPGVVVGEDLAHRALVGVGHLAPVEDVVVLLEACIAALRELRPLMLVRGVVEDEVDDEGDAVRAQLGRERFELLHVAEGRIHLPIARHRVAAVAVFFRRREERHEVQVGQAQFSEIRDSRTNPVEVLGIAVDVADAAEHLVRLKPGRVALAPGVERRELVAALLR